MNGNIRYVRYHVLHMRCYSNVGFPESSVPGIPLTHSVNISTDTDTDTDTDTTTSATTTTSTTTTTEA